jgi:hypothetical protein
MSSSRSLKFASRTLATSAFGIAALAPASASAQSRWLSTIWMIEPTVGIPAEQEYAGGDVIIKQRLVPAGLAALTDNFSDPQFKIGAPAGTQFFEVQSGVGRAFCDGRHSNKKANAENYICLVDKDQDGSFEGAFKGLSDTAGIPTIAGKFPKVVKPISPIRYTMRNPLDYTAPYFVAIQRRNFFNIYGRESFTIRFGTDAYSQEITDAVQFKAAELPKDLDILGAHFTAVSEVSGKMRIKVHATMPAQPFAIVQTTTYRFY